MIVMADAPMCTAMLRRTMTHDGMQPFVVDKNLDFFEINFRNLIIKNLFKFIRIK